MKSLFIILLSLSATVTYSQVGIQLNTVLRHDIIEPDTFLRLDTTKGYVLYYTTEGQKFAKGYKVDSVFRHQYYKSAEPSCPLTYSGLTSTTLEYRKPILVSEERRVLKHVVANSREIGFTKDFKFVSELAIVD